MRFTEEQPDYLRSQRLGRLAPAGARGAPPKNPVTFWVDEEHRLVIGGRRMGVTRKFRNVRRRPRVAFVVDDLVTVRPWRPRMLEVRGTAEALTDVEPHGPGFSREIIRITAEKV